MTGAHHQRKSTAAIQRSPVSDLLWFLALVSILQWTAPAAAPAAAPASFLPPAAIAAHDVGLGIAERQLPAVEAGAAVTTIILEKRPPAGRTVPPAEDGHVTVAQYPAASAPGRTAAASTAPRAGPGSPAGLTFTARSPPAAG